MWILIAIIYSNNAFYGYDAVPNGPSFRTQAQCEYAITKITAAVGNEKVRVNTKLKCINVS